MLISHVRGGMLGVKPSTLVHTNPTCHAASGTSRVPQKKLTDITVDVAVLQPKRKLGSACNPVGAIGGPVPSSVSKGVPGAAIASSLFGTEPTVLV